MRRYQKAINAGSVVHFAPAVYNWPVETTSARQLTSDLFARQAADPALKRGLALQLTILALIDGPGAIDPSTGRTAFNYSHPIFWAPFSLVGDGGSSNEPTLPSFNVSLDVLTVLPS